MKTIAGILRRPRSTFEQVVSHPRWGLLLLLTTVVSAGAGAALMETTVGRQALVDQWEQTAAAFGRPVGDQGYARLEELSDRAAPAYAVLGALVSGPLVAAGTAAALYLVFRGRATFQQAMAVTAHAGVILALRQVLAAPITYVRESSASATSVGSWFWALDEASPVSRFLGALDLFVIWWAIVLAIGVAVLYRRRARTVATVLVSLYAAAAALLAALAMVASGGRT